MTLGVVIFLGGVALLLFTFKLAYDMFSIAPAKAVVVSTGGGVDLGKSGDALVTVLLKILLLIVMGVMGSLIANRGVHLFTGSRSQRT